ncbi:hypothetical protein Pfo_018205 [Paulownia fortunei]|nr:hypothetical protein Pfo_018205 [Paulownia fortunei]
MQLVEDKNGWAAISIVFSQPSLSSPLLNAPFFNLHIAQLALSLSLSLSLTHTHTQAKYRSQEQPSPLVLISKKVEEGFVGACLIIC